MKYNFRLISIFFLIVLLFVARFECGVTREVICKANEWKCANKRQCIPNNYLCDKYNDCIDGSDEQNCKIVSTQSTKKTTPKSTTRIFTTQKPITGPAGKQKCGQPVIKPITSNSRIVGGVPSKPHSWPWQVYIELSKNGGKYFQCGGSIINETTVLTAGHCVDYKAYYADRYWVTAGVHNIKSSADGEHQVRKVKAILLPDTPGDDHDIAILVLSNPLVFNDNVSPVCLPTAPVTNERECYSTGWGDTHEQLPETILNQVQTPIVNWDLCRRYWFLTPSIICAGQNGASTCFGDSGGPLTCQLQNSRWYLNGITSGGTDECDTNIAPARFTSVYHYVDWITAKTGFKFE